MSSPGPDPVVVKSCGKRLHALRAQLSDLELDGMVLNFETDIEYLTGFCGHDSLLLVFPDAAFIICDTRYDEALEPWRDGKLADVIMGIRHRLEDSAREICGRRNARRVGFQADRLTVDGSNRLADALGDCELIGTSGLINTLRMRKDDHEVARIEQAIAWQQDALRATLGHLHPGMTELQLSARLAFEMTSRGAFGPSFDAIVGSGANASVIHHQTSETPIEPGVLLVDWGALTPDGYCSDLTRTFAIGAMPSKIGEIYDIVLEAQLAAIDACRPGITCAEVDAVARRIITDAGYGPQFGHGLGHGLGKEVHESPYFNDLQTDVVLAPGMVMTVEPGIYLPGVGGVRIEDDVLITDTGRRVLSDMPRDRDSAVIEFATANV